MQDLEPPVLVLLAPVMPAATGNGLAMRAGMQLQALSGSYDVRLVVVPVAGGSQSAAWAAGHASSIAVVLPDDPDGLRAGITQLMGEAVWRDRFGRAEPLPGPAAWASPALAASVVVALGDGRQARVHAIRAYLAPLAVAVAERVRAPWTTLDLDDDDVHVLESAGRHDEGQAYGRLLETFGSEFDWLSLASAEDATRVAERYGLSTTVVPNSVAVPSETVGRTRRKHGRTTLLFVGNLTYGPNIEAVEILAREVLPRVRRLVDGPATVELIGRYEPHGPVAALAGQDGVELCGYVEDLNSAYARADLTVVPLRTGGGTRIKLLEAFAAGVPVVTTAVGAGGLEAEPGKHMLIGEDADELAAAVARLVLDEDLATKIARAARSFVEERFSSETVGGRLRELMAALESAERAVAVRRPVGSRRDRTSS